MSWANIAGMALLISVYTGVRTDWSVYRLLVIDCAKPGCTYFEPGFDLITFISAYTFGFDLIKLLLILSFTASIFVAKRGIVHSRTIIVVVVSVSVASLPLMLGAIRQALTLPLVLVAIFLVYERRLFRAALVTLIAGSLHYSAVVVVLWYGVFWYFFCRQSKAPTQRSAMLFLLLSVGLVFLMLKFLSHSNLADSMAIVARIGETGVNTDTITTGGILRDVAILFERVLIALAAVVLLVRRSISVSASEKIFLLMYVAGSALFMAVFAIDRNVAGRMLATFRLADVMAIVTVVQLSTSRLYLTRQVSPLLALVAALTFMCVKSYVTMSTVGFFDE